MNKVISQIEQAKSDKNGSLIMVVDDDPAACTTFKNILLKRNYNVGTAHTGEEAIELARQKSYDIIFIDMKLPTINGLETYKAIKKANPEAVAIMMTAYRQEVNDLVQEALNNSAYTCIYKPLGMANVLQLVEEIREKKHNTEPIKH